MLTALSTLLSHVRQWLVPGARAQEQATPADELPLRAELFSADQMEQHGRSLAASHRLTERRGPDRLLPRLAANEAVLAHACALLTAAVRANRRITPGGEWLLDNFYLIEEQIRTAKRHLPKGYSRELPCLASGPSKGLPRVYSIALETIAHGDGRVDPDSLARFVAAYQSVTPITLGELWAIPIMLRLALIENLRRVAADVAAGRVGRDLANTWADQMTTVAAKDPKSLILVIADMARSNPPLTTAFVAELARRLQGHGPALALPLTWIEQRLSESNQTIEQLVQAGSQLQAANQVSISNSIGSLRFLGAMDWRTFVEAMSSVEAALRADPHDVYARMDFATRDRYRHAVEALAKRSTLSETEVAQQAVSLAHAALSRADGDARAAHVGFYLVGAGHADLVLAVGARRSRAASMARFSARVPVWVYLGSIGLLTGLVAATMLAVAHAAGVGHALLAGVGVLALVSGSQLAISLVNWLLTLVVTPHALPKMDYSTGIPDASRTMVVVPSLLTSTQAVEDLVEALEVRFLANRDSNLHFALLTDFADAPEATLPTDAPLLALAKARIAALNTHYGMGRRGLEPLAPSGGSVRTGADIFYLLHRPRRLNTADRIWMGYERKRGKLSALNALLRGDAGARDAFAVIVGDVDALGHVQYVLTLDTDTELPRDAARELAGAMAHPLNRAYYDSARARVTRGYGILQPRVVTSLPGANRSRFARLFGGDSGIDPYTRAVSDVYQDAFGEGSFIGKGIYDVDAFESALKDRFPENRILSHDLLEGSYARSGLITDVQLYEDYPAEYRADVSRRERWIRGDWQIAGWLLRGVPGGHGKRLSNPLSFLSQWKIFDNLRRSLVPAAMLLLLLLGWTVLAPAWWWTLAVLAIPVLPVLIGVVLDLAQKPPDAPLLRHLVFTARTTSRRAQQLVFLLACLPYDALFSLKAILLTHWRMLVSHRHLLEWTASSEERRGPVTLVASYRSMVICPVLALATAAFLVVTHRTALAAAAPLLLLWLAAPALAWWLSRPLVPHVAAFTRDQVLFLRQLARRTWGFFETFVAPADNWLPPDNFQEVPTATVAHRTSPTNIGLALLADLAARDFGYLTTGRLLDRTTHVMESLQKLERYQGHFYNWYDTLTLEPLPPRYISTVDSGNLAGHLLTLREGITDLCNQPVISASLFAGMADTARVLATTLGEHAQASVLALAPALEAAGIAYAAEPDFALAQRELDQLAAAMATLDHDAAGWPGAEQDAAYGDQGRAWVAALQAQYHAAQEEVQRFAPWLKDPACSAALVPFPPLQAVPTLRALSGMAPAFMTQLATLRERATSPADHAAIDALAAHVDAVVAHAAERTAAIADLAMRCEDLAWMEFGFLYDPARHLFAVGYNVDDRQRDTSFYDLLASEARLATFVAIAQGQVPQESWFALGRQLTATGDHAVLLSWSGSMFEYLMPMLVMPSYANTLLDQTCVSAVDRQIEYGRELGIPWGMSESGYNAVDANLNYQYRAFGVPGLGLKRGLAEDVVIAPYASVMALMVAPEAACANLQRLAADGLAGRFGMHEAVDYTPTRLPRGQTCVVVRSFMAHHEGMSLLALDNLLLDGLMQRRFASDPLFQSTLLLLQERIPKASRFFPHLSQHAGPRAGAGEAETPVRVITSPSTAVPEVQLLSNGRYHVMVTGAGGGSSRWKDQAITRWREDSTRDNWGTFCYLRDMSAGEFWSTAFQPVGKPADLYEAIFLEGRAEFRRRDHGLDVHTEIAVSPEDDIELRRVRLTNRSRVRKVIELTTYSEVVLAPAAADDAHPAFSNLFVQTEVAAAEQAILCTRRRGSPAEQAPWMFHLVSAHQGKATNVSYETDRMRFIGRGNSLRSPQAMREATPLSGSQGSVLDPIVAIRMRVTLEPEETATIDMVYGVGDTRDAALGLVRKYQDPRLADRVVELAWTHAQVVLRQINATEADARLYARLANSIVFANASLRADASVLARNRRGQSGLWGYAISGDLPIVLLRIADAGNTDLVRQLVQAHAYWRLKGLSVDLVIWNEDHGGYRQLLQDRIVGLIAARVEAQMMDRPGGIFVRRSDQISEEDRILLMSVARVIITDGNGTLAEQVEGRALPALRVPPFAAERERVVETADPVATARPLILANGLGGFTPDGTEYVITTDPRRRTPAPWANVLANPDFGTIVSESGSTYTWRENAHEYRLTPWSNDAVSDTPGEAFYLRDEETGHFWSPTPLPARGRSPYVTRHGFGYSVFEHSEDGIVSELWIYVAHDAAVKFSTLKIRNASGRPRRISVTGYVEWVLGDLRPKSVMHVITEKDAKSGTLFARNPYSPEFSSRVAFFDTDDPARTLTCDRAEFLGRNGTFEAPAAMRRARLSGKSGPGLDPCAAIQVMMTLAPGEEREQTFRLGAGRDIDDARVLAQRFRGALPARAALEAVREQWQHTLGAVRVTTPDESLNVLCNGWLLYQTLAARVWARSGFYQSGGAFGFRDQLQDVLALVHAEPGLTRAHLLLCASRQFVEGDVQHWWHPPAGRGVRTQCSDDYLWLPLGIARYVLATGDTGILDEPVPFLEGRAVNHGEDSYYDLPARSSTVATLYDHGARALLHGLRYGSHGLPLMGSGDWNDGMNLVGIEGRGESVWLAFFLCKVLEQYAQVAQLKGDTGLAERCATEATTLRANIDQHAWDGGWYRRAYFDDGTPLGSASNVECRIDAIAQSWSVISGAGDAARSRTAMDALHTQLVKPDEGLVLLLTPPFDQALPSPGYIRGYVPGVRENGGQYTHGAIWSAMAFAGLGDAVRAWQVMDLINPVNHGRTAAQVAVYRSEPYVATADVYANAPHTGRGGWSWYTGSAGWMYRLVIESLLGLTLAVDKLHFAPCLPAQWTDYKLVYRYRETQYHITVEQGANTEPSVWLDGVRQEASVVPLTNDQVDHVVRVLVRPAAPA